MLSDKEATHELQALLLGSIGILNSPHVRHRRFLAGTKRKS